ncbi:MAG: ABC transporter ATP-binding protein [Candidatus Omnitrophica bacterium]|nr:ABC transporter ATP-binding protein [Candidatus Omnitrophota bacterium]
MNKTIVSINDVSVNLLPPREGGGYILRAVSFDVSQGGIVGVVGGSGSGKTTLGLAMLGLLPEVMTMSSGRIIFEGKDITRFSDADLRAFRGFGVSMAFQEPVSAFDPVMTIGAQIRETVLAHERISPAAARERVLQALRHAGIGDPVRVASAYAFELSGGLRQRAMIAQAIVCRPKLLIADEPTSNLDVNTQDKILELFKELRSSLGLSIMLITHDLGVVRRVADEVVVLCRGSVVEQGKAAQVMTSPRAEYTKLLLAAEG